MQSNICAICHYGEIGLKGKNRRFFERQLVSNIRELLPDSDVSAPRGRVVVSSNRKDLKEILERIPGIVYFFFAEVVNSSIEDMEKRAVTLLKERNFESFRVTVKRSDKSFELSSYEIACKLGEVINKETGKRVDLSNPDITCWVEIHPKVTYIYVEKMKGVGGLPVGTGGKAVSLLSGGIDSPVASFRTIKRGVKNIFVHFHAYPTTSKESIDKAKSITSKLSSYQGETTLYLIPFDELQKEIVLGAKESLRVLLYRRIMVSIACEIAKKEGAGALVTGESLGQVASQTMENIRVTDDAADIPIFRPLLGYDKEEIIEEAKNLGTYDISILPEDDCCVRFLPHNPETKGEIHVTKTEEERILNKDSVIREVIENSEREIIRPRFL